MYIHVYLPLFISYKHSSPSEIYPLSLHDALPICDLRGERLVDFQPRGTIRDLPRRHVDRPRDLLHLVVIDLIRTVTRAVIVFVHAVEEEDDRNPLARVVEMIAAIEETIRILRIVVTRIERQ